MRFKQLNNLISVLLVISFFGASAAQQANAPTVEQLRRHVTYLASEHLEGRRTGTQGANDAAHYIAGEFSQLGLRPAFQTIRKPRNRAEARANYRQKFPYIAGVTLGSGNSFSFSTTARTQNLELLRDWIPFGYSTNAVIENAPVRAVGYGITATELNHNDYANVGTAGYVAIAYAGTPDGDNPHGPFSKYRETRWKAIAARNSGAKALVVITRESSFHASTGTHLRYDNSTGDSGIPVLLLSETAGQRITGRTVVPASDASILPPEKLPASTVSVSVNLERQEAPAYNIVGILNGSDPVLKKETIVIGAHYDHLGRGGQGSLAPRSGEVHHGADDNASGVAGVLELARLFTAQRPKPRRTIVFIAFSGEEEGLLGSNYYVNNPVVPLANTVAMVNMDMIGRLKDKKLVIGGIGTAQEWRSLVESANIAEASRLKVNSTASQAGTNGRAVPLVVGSNGAPVVSSDLTKQFLLTLNEDGYGPSDHSSFYSKQIPVLFFWTGTHNDYHKPSDTAEKINYEDQARIVSLVRRLVREVDAGDKRPTYTTAKAPAAGRSMGFRVYLGTIPNYGDATDGLLLDGVREGSPAEKAGLKAGDKVVKLGPREIRNVYDYTYALGEMKAGQEYDVEVIRGTERLKLKLTPEPRN